MTEPRASSEKVVRAVAASRSLAAALGLRVEDAVVLQEANRVTVRLMPCDVVVRVSPAAPVRWMENVEFEVALAERLRRAGAPVVGLDPRVEPRMHLRDGFAITFWTYQRPLTTAEPDPGRYASALQHLHRCMRDLDIPTPRFTDRIEEAEAIVASRERSPDLADDDRRLVADALRDLKGEIMRRGAAEQILHGEPHAGNVLFTRDGLLFIDLETCCRGPVEFDVAHAPVAVGRHYPGVDRDLLRACRTVVIAMVAAWRWDRTDVYPGRDTSRQRLLAELRRARERRAGGGGG